MSRKRGKLSKAEEKFILENVHELSLDEIAEAMNRTTAPVEKFIKAKNLKNTGIVDEDEYNKNLMMNKLRDRNYHKELKDMLTEREMLRFEEDWVEVMLQFRDDVMYTEEVQLKQWILLQILADRSMKSRKGAMQESTALQLQIDEQMELDDDLRDVPLLNNLNQQLGFAREGMIAFTREHSQLLDKIKDIEKSLKATRDARVKKIENSKTSWQGYLRILEEEQKRRNAGDDAEIKRMAKDKARERLSKWHKYEDGKVDQPLLTPETVLEEIDRTEEDYE